MITKLTTPEAVLTAVLDERDRNQVEWAKKLIQTRAPSLLPLKQLQDTTDLRVEMERHSASYFGKPHLARALHELGFKVEYNEWPYFISNFRSDAFRKLLSKPQRQAERRMFLKAHAR